jgi:hypothetical protein
MVGGYAAVSAFPYNVRYALPALLGFLAMVADIFARASRSSLARCALGGLFALSLLADWQWYYSPAYRKEDSRAVAKWLIENEDRIKSWTIVPGYSAEPVQWYLEALGHPEMNSRLEPSKQNQTTSFPPVPDALIIGRRDHMIRPDALIAAYEGATANPRKTEAFAGLDIFTRNPMH